MMNEYPDFLVAIQCITYDHTSYIEDAMNGFCMQHTSFPYVAIIIDDASTDGEPVIIERYMSSNFDFSNNSVAKQWETDDAKFIYAQHKENRNCYFAAVFLKYNFHSQKKAKAPFFNFWDKFAKYIALCEGDDYWTVPNKLQKQVDFLENHPDYSMCFHEAIEHWETGDREDKVFSEIENRDYTGGEIFDKWTVPTASVVLTKAVYESAIYQRAINDKKFCHGDIVLFLCCCSCGRIKGFSDVMSVYRRHEGSMTFSYYNIDNRIKFAYHCLEIYRVFGKEYKKSAIRQFFEQGINPFFYSRNMGQPNYVLLRDLFIYAPVKTIYAIMMKLIEKIKNRFKM